MPKNTRSGQRMERHQRTGRLPERSTKFLILVTDGKETEINYIDGLKNSLPEPRIGMRIKHENSPANLVKEYLRLNDEYAYREPELWIFLDRDNVPNFDNILIDAKVNGIQVAWSNPCIELWFMAHFGNIESYTQARQCIDDLKNVFFSKTGVPYRKNDEEIYRRLTESGDEMKAIERAEDLMRRYRQNSITTPSDMLPGTTVSELIKSMKINSE